MSVGFASGHFANGSSHLFLEPPDRVDYVRALRRAEEDKRNKERHDSWAARFKILGPRPEDLPKGGTK